MPLSPRRLPRKFNRSVTSHTRKLVEARHQRRKQYSRERWQRTFIKVKRQLAAVKKLFRIFLIMLGLGLLVLLAWLVFFSSIFSVSEIRVRRTDRRIDEELVHAALRPIIGEHLLYLSGLEVRPLLTEPLPRTDRPAVPDLADVAVLKDYPASVVIQIELDPIIAKLAIETPGEKPKESTGSSLADYMTNKGMYVAYQPNQVASGATLPVIRIVDWGVRPSPWSTLLEPTFLDQLEKTEQQLLEQFSTKITQRAAYIRAREYHLQTPEYSLWFDFKSPMEDQLQRYRTFLQTVAPGTAKQYVDLRLHDRIVYK